MSDRRWIVAFDNGVVEAPTAADAIAKCVEPLGLEIGHELIVVDLDAIDGTDRVGRFRIGAVEVSDA